MDAGDREGGGEREAVVHQDPGEDFRRALREPLEESFELPIGGGAIPKLEEVHAAAAQAAERGRVRAADAEDGAGNRTIR